jgi:hypothetical protein
MSAGRCPADNSSSASSTPSGLSIPQDAMQLHPYDGALSVQEEQPVVAIQQ